MKFAALLAGFVIIQILIVVVCFSRLRSIVFRNDRFAGVSVLLAVVAVTAMSLLLGAYVEANYHALTDPLNFFQLTNRTAPPKGLRGGNPALLEMLDVQSPVRQFPDGGRLDDFEQWQADLRRMLRDDVFKLPDISVAKDVTTTVHSTSKLVDDIVRKSIVIVSDDGVQIPAYLFLPSDAGERPAIIVVPGHVEVSESGIEQTGVLANSYQHAAALKLAKAGFVTLTLELRGFGRLGRAYMTEHRLVAYNAILAGTFYKAVIAKDIKNALDFLQNQPEVDPQRIGITGASFGGEMSVVYAALDPRIKSIVFQAYGGDTGIRHGVTGTRFDQPHYCHVIPGANMLFRNEDMFHLLAPRPTLGIRGSEESFPPRFYSAIEPPWSLFGKPSNLEIATESGGHEYFVQPAIDFFRKHL